jgi:predicted NodU family carbamoyl transferase
MTEDSRNLSVLSRRRPAAVVCDGEITAAAQEERFTRRKHEPEFPRYAMQSSIV